MWQDLAGYYIHRDTSAGMRLFEILGGCSTAEQSMDQREAKSNLRFYVFLRFTNHLLEGVSMTHTHLHATVHSTNSNNRHKSELE